MTQKRQRGICATARGILLLQEAQGKSENGRLTYNKIAEGAKVSEKTVGRFFTGERVDPSFALAIINFLHLSKEDVLSLEASLIRESIEQIESSNTANSENAQQLIVGLEISLNKLNQDKEIDLQAIDWFKANRMSLAKEAVEAVLSRRSSQTSTNAIDESDVEQLSRDIRKHLQLLCCCLEEGSWDVVDEAIQESLIPINREVECYTEALIFIRDQKIDQYLSPKVAQTVTLCLNYLIGILPLRF